MSRRLTLALVLALVAGMTVAAYAEVQNVKVSGDLNVWAIGRENLDLAKTRPTDGATAVTRQDTQKNVLSATRVRIDADLTDNVATTVRLINERDWTRENASNTDIDLDLAYATLKEFLYSPLTLTVGRQEIRLGNQMIIGDSNGGLSSVTSNGIGIYESDLSLKDSFDAIRATLNYDPLVVDLIYAKINEGTITVNDDTTLYGVNANYALTKETNLEGYAFNKVIDSGATKTGTSNIQNTKADKVFVVGGKASNTSVKNLMLSLESAFQFGTYSPAYDVNAVATAKDMRRRAWAIEAMAMYDLKDVSKIAKYAPMLSGYYAFFSGDNSAQKRDDETWHGWDPMFENQAYGHLANAIFAQTNSHIVGMNLKCKPVEDVTFSFDYIYYWLSKSFRKGDIINFKGVAGANTYLMTHSRQLGQEFDTKFTYDYTEDVQFGLLSSVFIPGGAFEKDTAGNQSIATEVIGSMKVTF